MQRISHQSDAEAIAYALELIPDEKLRYRLESEVDFFVGDSVFAGLETDTEYEAWPDHWTNDAPHAGYTWNQIVPLSRRAPTIVFPQRGWLVWEHLLHEMGHMAHAMIDFWDLELPAVTDYAATNPHEAFAEAFVTWYFSWDPWWADLCGAEVLDRNWFRSLDYVLLGEPMGE